MKITYRKEIDGLRAIAVLSVIFYHLNIEIHNYQLFKGGFIGVDIFFVISGYLITKILLKELKSNKDISIKNFYLRRAKRILPALFFVIFFVFIISYFYLLPSYFLELSNSVFSILFFFSNIYFLGNQIEYGNFNSDLNPFLHTWTLSLEEQFYIIFPFFLLFLYKFFPKKILSILIIIIFVSFFSNTLVNYFSSFNNKFFQYDFYLLPFRAWEILLGSVGALLKFSNNFKKIRKLGDFGFCLILISIFFLNFDTYHLYVKIFLPCLGTFFIIMSDDDNFTKNFLSNQKLVFIGLISYSLYLWHFPFISILKIIDYENINYLRNNYYKLFYIIIIFIFSIFSYLCIEKPFRNKKLLSNKIAIKILILSCAALILICIYSTYTNGIKSRFKNYSLLLKNYQINNNFHLNEWKKDLFKFYSYKSKKNFDKIENKSNILIIGNSFAVDIFNLFNENQARFDNLNFLFLRIGTNQLISKKDEFLEFKFADHIVLGTKFDSNISGFSRIDSLNKIKNEILELKKVTEKHNKDLTIFLARPEFSINSKNLNKELLSVETRDYDNNYTMLDAFIHQKINKNEIITIKDFEKWESLYFSNITMDKIKFNNQLKPFLKKNKIKYIDPFKYSCDLLLKRCKIVTDNYEKIYFDYGHYTLSGAKYFGEIINKDLIK